MYNINSPSKFKSAMLKSSLCDYRDLYMLVKRIITFVGAGADNSARATDNNNKQQYLKILHHLPIV